MRSQTYKRAALAAIGAIAATLLAASTAQAGCGTNGLNGNYYGQKCRDNGHGTRRYYDQPSSGLGSVRGSRRHERGVYNNDLGTVRRPRRWDRRRSLGRGTYKPY